MSSTAQFNSTDHAIAGVGAAVITTLCLHPMDLIKTRLQVGLDRQTSLEMVKTLYRNNGPKGLYQGLSANMAGSTLSWGFYFLWYNMLKNQMIRNIERRADDSTVSHQLSATDHMIAAFEAGLVTAFMTNPIWLMKTRLCIQDYKNPQYRGLVSGLLTVYRQEGLRGLYKGMVPSIFGVSHGAVQFSIYEELKKAHRNLYPSQEISSLAYVAMAAGSKTAATIITYPYQVVRSKLQADTQKHSQNGSRRLLDIVRVINNTNGIRGFYKGMSVNILRVLPGTCLTFVSYETIAGYLKQQRL
ncbi:hypothetical protein MP228_008008 [Amoeboaphelidium protococcarum]|nr:hypothetical protein MP228_008008 [Amoeboaphelidium protococcarum]